MAIRVVLISQDGLTSTVQTDTKAQAFEYVGRKLHDKWEANIAKIFMADTGKGTLTEYVKADFVPPVEVTA